MHLLYVLEQALEREQLPSEVFERYLGFIKEFLAPRYVDFIGKEIQTAYLESYSEYGQNIFDRYVTYADFWIQDQEYRDPETGELFNRQSLNEELEKIEKPIRDFLLFDSIVEGLEASADRLFGALGRTGHVRTLFKVAIVLHQFSPRYIPTIPFKPKTRPKIKCSALRELFFVSRILAS